MTHYNTLMTKNTDIILIGSGMAGLAAAALLGRAGFSVAVVDRVDPALMARPGHDTRTVALSRGTRDILAPLGVWGELEQHAAAITTIDVQEGHDPFVLNFAADGDVDAFGWILPNDVVRAVLFSCAKHHGVRFVAPAALSRIQAHDDGVDALLENGDMLSARLVVGADGRTSRARALCGIPSVNWTYKQTALVGLVTHEHPHHGLAVERFYTDGPFAILPFVDDEHGAHRSAIVWTQESKMDSRFRGNDGDWDIEKITIALQRLFDARYGAVTAVGPWAAYPLTFNHAKKMVARRVALVSDAAHGMHPIAGQGLNVGMRDVAELVAQLVAVRDAGGDIGGDAALVAYQRARRFDVMTMMAATDILNRLFGSRVPGLRLLRSAGLGAVDRLPPLKRFFANIAMGQK
jgi:2-octaprenyl-6-methoxyphenol hydroxylase